MPATLILVLCGSRDPGRVSILTVFGMYFLMNVSYTFPDIEIDYSVDVSPVDHTVVCGCPYVEQAVLNGFPSV